jgi:hypothetical protein
VRADPLGVVDAGSVGEAADQPPRGGAVEG